MIRRSKKAKQCWSMVKQLDALARAACFERDGHRCVRCGSDKVQWSHIIGRRHKCTRWELNNALSMCAGCHRWWHEYPTLSGDWFRKNWPERHERITALYNAGGKVNLQDKLDEFTPPPAKRTLPDPSTFDVPF